MRTRTRTLTTTVGKIRPGDVLAQYRLGGTNEISGMSVYYVTNYGTFWDIGLEGNGRSLQVTSAFDHPVRIVRTYPS